MKLSRLFLGFCLSLCFAMLLGHLTAGRHATRLLTTAELLAIRGAGVGNCDQGVGAFQAGLWTCFTVGSFACDSVCDRCPGNATSATCTATSCWDCGTGQIKECKTSPTGTGCTDMGNIAKGTPCNAGAGSFKSIATCTWTPTVPPAGICACPGPPRPTSVQLCQRYDCL